MSHPIDHVTDDRLRDILITRSTTEDDMCYALHYTDLATLRDLVDDDIDPRTASTRRDAFDEADFYWNIEGIPERSMDALVRCWS